MRRVWLLETLQRVIATINQKDDVENSLPIIARTIYEQFGLVSVGIGVLEDGWMHYRGVASRVSSTRNRVPVVPFDSAESQHFPLHDAGDTSDTAAMDAIDRSAKVPIRVNGDVYGVLSVAVSIDNRLTGEELEILEQIASVLGTAVEQSRRRNQQRDKLNEMTRLQEILSRIQEHVDPRDVNEDVLREIEDAFGFDHVDLGTITAHDLYLHHTFQDACQGATPAHVLPVSQGVAGRAARSGRPQVVRDAHADPDFVPLRDSEAALACVPIWSIDEVIGVLRVSSDSVDGISSEDLQPLFVLADRFSLVMANLRRRQELERRAEQIRILEQVTATISKLVPTRAAISDVVEDMQSIWGHLCSIALIVDDKLVFHGPNIDQAGSRTSWTTDGLPLDRGITGRVARTGEPEFIREVDADPDFLDFGFDSATEIVVPIRVDHKVIGVINVEATRDRPLDDLDFETLTIVGNHLGIALANYGTFSSEQSTRKALEAVQRVSTIVAQTLDPAESLRLIAETLAAVLRYPIVAVEVIDQDRLKLAASFGFPPGVHESYPLDTGITGRVAASGEIEFLRSLEDDPSAVPYRDDAESGIYVPIRTGNTITGVLTVQGTAEHELTDWDAGLLRTFAESAGVLLANTQTYDEMRSTASMDSITGVANHRFFLQRLRQAMDRARRQDEELSLLVIDIDTFKDLNDRFGHIEGDHILAEIAKRLNNQLRGDDFLARYAGDEFVVILPGVTMRVSLEIAARLLRAIRSRPFELSNGETVVVTLSIGAATFPADASTEEELIAAADTAMYLSKGYGRDAVCHFRDVALLDAGETNREPIVRIEP